MGEEKNKYFAIVWQVIGIVGVIAFTVLYTLYKDIIFIIILLVVYIISLALAAWYISKRYILNEFIEKIREFIVRDNQGGGSKEKDNQGGDKKIYTDAKEFKISLDMDGYSFSLEVKNDGVSEAQGTSGTSDT